MTIEYKVSQNIPCVIDINDDATATHISNITDDGDCDENGNENAPMMSCKNTDRPKGLMNEKTQSADQNMTDCCDAIALEHERVHLENSKNSKNGTD